MFVLSNNYDLFAIEKATGKIVWNTQIPLGKTKEDKVGVTASGPVLTSNRLLIATSNGYAFAVSPYTGKFSASSRSATGSAFRRLWLTIPPFLLLTTPI